MHLNKLVNECPQCGFNGVHQRMRRTTTLSAIPDLLILSINSPRIILEPQICLTSESMTRTLRLAGLIYHSPSAVHFTCVVVNEAKELWYHDGMTTKDRTRFEGTMDTLSDARTLNMKGYDSRLCTAIYCAL